MSEIINFSWKPEGKAGLICNEIPNSPGATLFAVTLPESLGVSSGLSSIKCEQQSLPPDYY